MDAYFTFHFHNVLKSGAKVLFLFHPTLRCIGGLPAKVLDSVAKCDIVCVYNEDILMEYREVLHRPKFKFPERKIDSLLAFITQKGIHSDRVPYDGNMPDEKDRPFYEVSLSVEDSFLVTGNLKHFPVTPKVVTPSQMIDIINNQ